MNLDRLLLPFFILLCQAHPQAMAQDSITVLLDLSSGTYGSLGPHVVGAQMGPPANTLTQVKVAKGQRLAYHFASRPDWTPPVLELLGHGMVPADSSLIPQEPFILVVVANRIPRLIPEARRWHELYLQALRSPTPAPLYQSMLCETMKLFGRLGQDSAILVTDWARELAEAEVADTHAVARLDSLLGGKFYELTCQSPKQ